MRTSALFDVKNFGNFEI